jgi:hypothetical protein
MIDSGDSYLDRNEDLFLTKLDPRRYRRWRQYSRSLTKLRCEVEIDGNRYWLTMDVSAEANGLVRFKEIDPTRLSWPAQQRYAERAERLLPDRIFAAREHLIFEHCLMLPMEERKKLRVDCGLVEYGDNQYRAHAYDDDYNEIHVTELSSYSGAKRLLREWAVANGLYYGGGHTRHRSPDELAQFRAACHAEIKRNGAAA